jgi:hypothetical protein
MFLDYRTPVSTPTATATGCISPLASGARFDLEASSVKHPSDRFSRGAIVRDAISAVFLDGTSTILGKDEPSSILRSSDPLPTKSERLLAMNEPDHLTDLDRGKQDGMQVNRMSRIQRGLNSQSIQTILSKVSITYDCCHDFIRCFRV